MVKIVEVCPFDDIEVFGCYEVFMVIGTVERGICVSKLWMGPSHEVFMCR